MQNSSLKQIDKFIRFLSSTAGRDKVYRVIQYISKLLVFYISKVNPNGEHVRKLAALSFAVGQGRKLFRIGKPVEHLLTINKVLSRESDEISRNLLITKSLGLGGWLLLDTVQWLNSVKVIQFQMQAINDMAPRLWLTGLAASFLYNIYRIELTLRENKEEGKLESGIFNAFYKDPLLQKCLVDAFQDLVDMIIPLSISGMISFDQGTVGAAGTITSIIGIVNLWPK